jgi:hypothetical protein
LRRRQGMRADGACCAGTLTARQGHTEQFGQAHLRSRARVAKRSVPSATLYSARLLSRRVAAVTYRQLAPHAALASVISTKRTQPPSPREKALSIAIPFEVNAMLTRHRAKATEASGQRIDLPVVVDDERQGHGLHLC